MLQLPRCPHCGMYFRYMQVGSGRMLGKKSCPHCRESFRAVIGSAIWLLALLLLAAAVALNMLLLLVMNANGFVVLFVSLIAALLLILLLPLTIRYRDVDKKEFSDRERSLLDIKPDEPQKRKKMSRSEKERLRKQKKNM